MNRRLYDGPDHMLEPTDYLFALDAEKNDNALSLLSGSAAVLDRLRDESFAREVKDPTQWRNGHPIIVIYTAQLADLAGLGPVNLEQYAWALDHCRQRAGLAPADPRLTAAA